MGSGPGSLTGDASAMGIAPTETRRMAEEGLAAGGPVLLERYDVDGVTRRVGDERLRRRAGREH